MSGKNEKIIESNPLLFRYIPNNRFIHGDFSKQIECTQNYEDFGESITDKESYRLSLAAKRGAISSLSPSQNKGWYMFEDGVYDSHKDFSTIMRKDLSIVDIENYEKILQRKLEESDEILKEDIKNQISELQKKKESVIKESVKNKNEPNNNSSSAGE